MGFFSGWGVQQNYLLEQIQAHLVEGLSRQEAMLRDQNHWLSSLREILLQVQEEEHRQTVELRELRRLLEVNNRIAYLQTELTRTLLHVTRRPGPLRFRFTRELHIRMGEMRIDLIGFQLQVPAVAGPSKDVVSRELVIRGAGSVDEAAGTYSAGDVSLSYDDLGEHVTDELFAPEDGEVTAELVDVDNKGNRSTPSTVTLVAVDQFAPAQPGVLGFTFTREITLDVAEEPATEAPAEEPTTEAPAEEPVAEEPATEAPAEEPATEAPAEEPATEAPAEEPVAEEPATEAPAEEPATEPPTL